MIFLRRNRGVTLTEILVTMVILSIIAGLAIPSYTNTVELSRQNEARTNLNVIYMAQKIYRINQGAYWTLTPNPTVAQINTALSTDINATFYTTFAFSAPVANSFRVRATRNLVQGGNGVSWVQLDYTLGNAAPVITNG